MIVQANGVASIIPHLTDVQTFELASFPAPLYGEIAPQMSGTGNKTTFESACGRKLLSDLLLNLMWFFVPDANCRAFKQGFGALEC